LTIIYAKATVEIIVVYSSKSRF